jgi:hypothetical protein
VTRAPTAGPAGDHSRIANHRLAPAPGVYAIEAVHTFVGFTAQHRVVGRVRGRVERVAGTVTIAEELIASSLEVTVETASISTPFVARDKDLRSDCFLDSDAHPTMTYRSTGFIERPRLSGGSWAISPSEGSRSWSFSPSRLGGSSPDLQESRAPRSPQAGPSPEASSVSSSNSTRRAEHAYRRRHTPLTSKPKRPCHSERQYAPDLTSHIRGHHRRPIQKA